MHDAPEMVKDLGDASAGIITVAAIGELLPPIAAAFAIIWTAIRIYEYVRVTVFKQPPRKGGL